MGCAITELKEGCSDSEVQTDIGASYEEMQEAHDFFCLVIFLLGRNYLKCIPSFISLMSFVKIVRTT